jgi:hypothetical protein
MVRALCARSQKQIAGGSAPAPWVTFSCLSKRKSPKRKTPRSRRHLPALLGKIGARLTRRALNNAPRAQTRGSLFPIFPAMLGGDYGDPKTPRCRGFLSTPYGAPEPRKALDERPQGRAQGSARLAHATGMARWASAGPKAAEARKSLRHPGRAFSWRLLFARAKRSRPGSGAEHPRFKHAAVGRSTDLMFNAQIELMTC